VLPPSENKDTKYPKVRQHIIAQLAENISNCSLISSLDRTST
jgi:hypothetical protein